MSRRALSDREAAEAVRLYRDSHDGIASLARRYGVDRATMRNVLRRAGAELRGTAPSPALTNDQVSECARLYRDEQVSSPVLARRFGVDPKSMREILQRAGVTLRKRGHNLVGSPLDSEQTRDAVARYQAGASLRALADRYGVSPKSVRTSLVDAGVKIRKPMAGRELAVLTKLSPGEYQQLIEDYEHGGASIFGLAKHYGLSANAVRRGLFSDGVRGGAESGSAGTGGTRMV